MKKSALRLSLSFAQLARLSRIWPQQVLLQHTRGLTFAILGLGLLIGCLLVAELFLLAPPPPAPAATTIPALAVAKLDELESWIEEQRRAVEVGLPLGSRQYFVVESID